MPRIEGTKGEQAQVKKCIKLTEQCISNAQMCYIEKEGHFKGKFHTYFGNATKAAMEDIVYSMALMGGELQGDNYAILVKAASGNDNASIDHTTTPYGQARPAQKQSDDAIWKINRRKNHREMWLHPQFFLASFAAVDTQSQVEIFIHELSHFAAGVIDYNPPNCYGMRAWLIASCRASTSRCAMPKTSACFSRPFSNRSEKSVDFIMVALDKDGKPTPVDK